jgi:ABC-type sugar transport system ATPase subunit
MVHQELAFCDNLTVGDNLCLRALPQRFGFVDAAALRERALSLIAATGARIDPDRPMGSLSVAEQQVVQIAAAVGEGAKVIIFDEPTSSLGDAEAKRLYALMGELKARGVTQLFVSHRMGEIFTLCDTVTVLRDGQHVATQPADALTEATLVRQMIGRELANISRLTPRRRVALNICAWSGSRLPVTFATSRSAVHAGEVVGLAGLVGAGRSEIARAIFGLDRSATRRGACARQTRPHRSPRDAMKLGIGLVPEDRKRQGLVLGMRARENATLPTLTRFARSRLGRPPAPSATAVARRASRAWRCARRRVKLAGVVALGRQPAEGRVVQMADGGNSDLLILDEPTRGVDVGAKAELHAWIDQRAAEGAAILLISSELPELLTLSSRILVLRDGARCAVRCRANRPRRMGCCDLMAGLG